MHVCKICNRQFDSVYSLAGHVGHHSDNTRSRTAWNKGKTKTTDKRLKTAGIKISNSLVGRKYNSRCSLSDYYIGKRKTSSHWLKMMLFKYGVKDKKCEHCELTTWLGNEIPFQLDHIDRNHNNNELENLQILCPTCHSIKTRKDRKTKKLTPLSLCS